MSASTSTHDLQRCLEQFMTATAARVVLKSTLEPLGLRTDAVPLRSMPQVVSSLLSAARHFVAQADRAKLESALGELLKKSTSGVESEQHLLVEIKTEADASRARTQASRLCQSVGGTAFHCQKVATGVSELARNQLSYAGGGKMEVFVEQTPKRLMRVRATDSGAGIPNLAHILSGSYQSKTGMGLGLLGTKRLADKFDVQSGPKGTFVEFEVWL